MKKLIIFTLFCIFTFSSKSQNIYTINTDTSFSYWDLKGKVLKLNAKVTRGHIINAIIEANPYIQIFDTSVILQNCKTKEFSTAWYGANEKFIDNWSFLQKAIDVCISNRIKNLYIASNYKFSKTLKFQNIYNKNYIAVNLNFYGDGDIWDQRTALTFTDSFLNKPAIVIQLAKGGKFSNFTLRGNYKSPFYKDSSYYTNSFPVFNGYSGIVIDGDGSRNNGGSTAFKIEDVIVSGFDVLYDISPNGVTANADILIFNNIQCGDGRIGIRNGQAQEKGNIINNITSWGRIHTIFQNGKNGKFQAGDYTINGGNIAGAPVQLFDVQQSGWNLFRVRDLYAESVGRLGYFGASTSQHRIPIILDGLSIRFALKSQAGEQLLITSQAPSLMIKNSNLWYYGRVWDRMKFYGNITFDNVDFGASLWSNAQCLNIKYNSGTVQYLRTQ